MKFIRLEDEYQNIPWNKCNRAALKEFITSVLCTIIYLKNSKKLDPEYCGTEEFESRSIIFKWFYFLLAIFIVKCKYYLAWKLAQSSINFCGLSYTKNSQPKEDKDGDFSKIQNVDIEKVELAANPKIIIQYWNRTVHLWLKYYLFLRIVEKPDSPTYKKSQVVASLVTFMVSAVWHGFYPVYYIFFFQGYIVEQINNYVEKEYNFFEKVENNMGKLGKFLIWLAFAWIIPFLGLSFTLKTFTRVYIFYKSFYFIPNIMLVSAYIYITFFTKKKRKQKD